MKTDLQRRVEAMGAESARRREALRRKVREAMPEDMATFVDECAELFGAKMTYLKAGDVEVGRSSFGGGRHG